MLVPRPRWHSLVALVFALASFLAPATAGAASQTINFNDLTNPNRALNGQYPSGTIDWGTNVWYLSGPFGSFTTQSISYNGSSATSAPFTFVTPRRLLQLDAYNGGRVSSTISLSCAGQPTKTATVAVGQLSTIATGWTGTCASATIGSTNGWDTNFDNLVIDDGLGPLISNVQANPTSSGATITWTTNIASDSQVEYGTTTAYGTLTTRDPTLVTSHAATLSGLSGGTTYHYRVRSADSGGNLNISGDFTFNTASRFCDPPVTNPVACENSKTGDPAANWDLPSHDAGDPSIQGFATDISYNKGQTVRFKISTPATAYRLDIYRMGYYGGMGARKQATVFPSATLPQTQPACLRNVSVGLVDCGNWADSASWTIPTTAVSGIYFARLVRTDTNGASHIMFIVRDDASTSPLLFQTSDTAWQAYNSYGGASLYTDTGLGTAAGRAYKVSYNRPFNTRTSINGLGPLSFVWSAEYPMVRWLEANGYNLSYISGVDTDRLGSTYLRQHGTYLSVGHDEYWSGGQRTNVEAARDAGVNLAFFSGNQTFWKTRYENSIDGTNTAYRTLVSYKETHANAKIDPNPAWTGTWRDPRFSPPSDGGRPENALAGQIFSVNGTNYQALRVPYAYSRLRFWRSTAVASLTPGSTSTITAGCSCVLGYEWDEDLDNGFRPTGLVPMSSTTANVPQYLQDYGSTYGPGTATHTLSLYRAPSGALVFGAGTVSWSFALDGNHDNGSSTPEPIIQQATVNVLADMGAQPDTLQPGLVSASKSTDTLAPTSAITSPAAGARLPNGAAVTIAGTASDAAGQVGVVEVSVDGGATWHRATGTTSWTYSWTPAVLGNVTIKSRAADDSGNVEAPSAGVTVTISGVVRVAFDDLTNNRVLNGQYPSGTIDWGTNRWYVSGPWGSFTTNSISYNGAGVTSQTFTLLKPMRIVQVDAFNGGTVASTVSISCAGQPTATVTVGVRQLLTIATGWTTTCSGTVTVTSSNGWDTNLDNLTLDGGS
jgi:Bacterial Ig domain/Purple acid Phosphatase, N-terminal domain